MPRGRGGSRHRGAGKQDLRHAGLGVRDASPALTKEINVWLRINGVDVENSNSIQSMVDEREIMSFSYVLELEDGDYVEVLYSVNDLTVKLNSYVATGSVPITPSVTINVVQL